MNLKVGVRWPGANLWQTWLQTNEGGQGSTFTSPAAGNTYCLTFQTGRVARHTEMTGKVITHTEIHAYTYTFAYIHKHAIVAPTCCKGRCMATTCLFTWFVTQSLPISKTSRPGKTHIAKYEGHGLKLGTARCSFPCF